MRWAVSLAIFLSGMLVLGIVYVQHILKTLDQIAGADTQIETMAVTVQDSNAAQSIEDTGGYLFGFIWKEPTRKIRTK